MTMSIGRVSGDTTGGQLIRAFGRCSWRCDCPRTITLMIYAKIRERVMQLTLNIAKVSLATLRRYVPYGMKMT